MMKLGEMPLSDFVTFHPAARVTSDEIATLKTYLAPWAGVPSPMNNAQGAGRKMIAAPTAPISLATVHPDLNGFPFDPSFENWKQISTTDRGDNKTFRFILGNEVAVKAARTGDILQWPNGARFAKIARQQESGPDGLIHPGQFIQVELMLKDAAVYKSTEGWGWGRWRGLDLTPYGMDSRFVPRQHSTVTIRL